MDFTTNYCGPFWSDGKFQSSVANGISKPVSALDAACQRHDRQYATHNDRHSLDVADTNFYNETKNLGFRGKLYGGLVSYFNQLSRGAKMNAQGPLVKQQLNWLHDGSRANEDDGLISSNNETSLSKISAKHDGVIEMKHQPVADLGSGEMPVTPFYPARYFPQFARTRKRHRKQKQKWL